MKYRYTSISITYELELKSNNMKNINLLYNWSSYSKVKPDAFCTACPRLHLTGLIYGDKKCATKISPHFTTRRYVHSYTIK